MASIPTNVIMVWTGTNASIPSGWSRETTLDSTFPKGWGAEAVNTTGGAATHTHTSPTHTHTMSAHTHTYSLTQVNSDNVLAVDSSQAGYTEQGHAHGSATSGAASTGVATSSTAVTYSAVSNDPPYRTVIFIKASAGAQLATNTVALWGTSNTAPTNWSLVTELSGRYMKGASTGADADLTTNNGSSSNLHTYNHSHTSVGHTHASATSAGSNSGQAQDGGTTTIEVVDRRHTHTVSLDSQTPAVTDYTATPAAQSETVEPSYRQLQAIKKGASGLKVAGMIGMWLGSTGTIPSGWSLYTAMQDYHCKIGDPTASTGGSNTHIHAAQGHTHVGAAHIHTGTISAHSNAIKRNGDNGSHAFRAGTGEHSVTSVQSVAADYASTNITADSSSNEPAYRTVAFIRFDKEVSGGSVLMNFI